MDVGLLILLRRDGLISDGSGIWVLEGVILNELSDKGISKES